MEKRPKGTFFTINSARSDYESAETWALNGSEDAMQRAHKAVKKQLNAYEKPLLDPAIEEALREYVEKRSATIDPKLFN